MKPSGERHGEPGAGRGLEASLFWGPYCFGGNWSDLELFFSWSWGPGMGHNLPGTRGGGDRELSLLHPFPQQSGRTGQICQPQMPPAPPGDPALNPGSQGKGGDRKLLCLPLLPPVPPSTPILVRACSLRPWHSEDVGGDGVGWGGGHGQDRNPIPTHSFLLWVLGGYCLSRPWSYAWALMEGQREALWVLPPSPARAHPAG